MRFSTIFLAIASLGAAYAAVEQPAAGADKLARRGEFREAVKRAAEPAAQGWGNSGNGGWGGAVFADGYCDADNDCPRLCRNQYGDQFNDEGTKCCFSKCSCAGGCQGSGSKNECDATNDCPRVCRERYGIDVDSSHSQCCSGNCNCYSTSCSNDQSPWGGWKN